MYYLLPSRTKTNVTWESGAAFSTNLVNEQTVRHLNCHYEMYKLFFPPLIDGILEGDPSLYSAQVVYSFPLFFKSGMILRPRLIPYRAYATTR